ncbi:ZIP family metal transporter [Henriciella aquimarina]|uniref:ZIP family metal transporter n=1 Tax=Henriciella aquimarina TaxID=545261 RepID=UPI000A061555|nr:ZIP family metal transporter [Henriciella aquimarina]
MWDSVQAPLFFGLIAAFMTTVGLIIVAQKALWSERNATLFGLVAAGMLATLTFLHILPEAFSMSHMAPAWLAMGFFGGLLMNNLIRALNPSRQGDLKPTEALTPVLAIAVHSFMDGVIYAVTFAASFVSGVYAAFGLILHEIPEGVIAFAILRRYGVSNANAFWFAFLAAAATTPLGVLVSGPFMYGLDVETTGALFAMSAGLLIFVATGPLMAPLSEMKPARGLVAIGAGACIALALIFAPGHGHAPGSGQHDHAHDEEDAQESDTLPMIGPDHSGGGSHDETVHT